MTAAYRPEERVCAILPIKPFGDAKERLATGLDPRQRREIAEAMVRDVLASLARSSVLESVVVVSAEPTISEIASGAVDAVLADRQTGHSAAARLGVEWAKERGFDRVVMLPGDCPLLDANELDQLLENCSKNRIELAVVPDRMGTGTNALVISPPDAITPAFGPDSRQRHIALGLAAARRTSAVDVPTLALDLDTSDDLVELAERLATDEHQAINTEAVIATMMVDRQRLPGGYAR